MTLGELKAKLVLPQDKANHDVFGSWIGDVAACTVIAVGLLTWDLQEWALVLFAAGCAAIVVPALVGGFNDWIDKKEGRVFSLQDVGYTALGGLQVGVPLMLPWFIV